MKVPSKVISRMTIASASSYSEKSAIAVESRMALKSGDSDSVITPISPQPKQMFFLDCLERTDIVCYGGSAGGGKTMALLMALSLRHLRSNPKYRGVIFRKTYAQVTNQGGLLDASLELYTRIGGKINLSSLKWLFPSGASIKFAQLQYDKVLQNYLGAEFTYLAVDEANLISEKAFYYLLSRVRSRSGISPKVILTSNPDPDSWLKELISWWLLPNGIPNPEKAGVIRYFVRKDEVLWWADTPEELEPHFPNIPPKSFTFVPANIFDNPALMDVDPAYLGNLEAQHPVDKARLLDGNWNATFSKGNVYRKDWFKVVDSIPYTPSVPFVRVRFWDLAASAKTSAFYTAGVRMSYYNNVVIVESAIAVQASPSEVDEIICETARRDGENCIVGWEREGGSSGVRDAEHIEQLLWNNMSPRLDLRAIPASGSGSKLLRAKPFARLAARGQVVLLLGSWNEEYATALENFDGCNPKKLSADYSDASAGALSILVNN